ncbi:GNAT family N-acetyltransferase [Acidisoma cellulosilytica]|uniref:GNAT family N-acetyltransferase n=1 Tax=Acidisoma cellulosilyticum TaxID=2802395 RepID=A0A964E388_9PROT|nr:GNAT family N-acetyltransferase [Acidisoma cellulosilyticum]MCB8879603.1 GNAT family N-acetyltransferase [Acidisoma cellulosilyticum]
MPATPISILPISDRPDLIPLITDWLWTAFWQDLGQDRAQTRDYVASGVSASGPPQTFVLLVDGSPVGTATLAVHDLAERPDLTPWLADVFVLPEARGFGYVGHLMDAVETACRDAGIATLWLYTHTAERIYAKRGWETVAYFERGGQTNALMRRDLLPEAECREAES